jgi:hypothetical protein
MRHIINLAFVARPCELFGTLSLKISVRHDVFVTVFLEEKKMRNGKEEVHMCEMKWYAQCQQCLTSLEVHCVVNLDISMNIKALYTTSPLPLLSPNPFRPSLNIS